MLFGAEDLDKPQLEWEKVARGSYVGKQHSLGSVKVRVCLQPSYPFTGFP